MEFPLRAMREELATVSRSCGADRNGFSPRHGFVPFEISQAENDLGTRLREVARIHRKSVALVDQNGLALEYEDLLNQATRVAIVLHRWLMENPDTPRIVAVVAQTGTPGIIGLIGSLLAGCAYFPIDPAWPDTRISKLLRESKAGILLADASAMERLQSQEGNLDVSSFDLSCLISSSSKSFPEEPLSLPTVGPGGTAAIFATSGSTGEPKLVALSHRAILFDIGRQTNDLFLEPLDRFDLLFSIGFSASLASIFGALLTGAQLHLFDLKSGLASLAEWLDDRDISLTTMSVSTLRSVFLTPQRRFTGKALRLVSVGSEPLLAHDVQIFQQLFPERVVLQNAMAATETRTYSQFFVGRDEVVGNVVPIGWPVAEKRVVLLDGNVVAQEGRSGEIAVRSRYLASGYINDPRLTAEKFEFFEDGSVQYRTGDLGEWAPDGSLIFLGRADWQVKIRGYRVELLAVEAALRRCSGVANCAVVAKENQPGEPRLVAYVVGLPSGIETVRKLRAFLANELPDYMVPSLFLCLEALPLNANGKIDRNRLPVPPCEIEDDIAAPVTPVETELRRIWSTVLKIDGFSRDATFEELGGDSLQLLQMQLHMRASFANDLPAGRSIVSYLHATLAETAAAIELESGSRGSGSALTQYAAGGTRGTVVFFPGIVGNFLNVEAAAPYVSSDWSVYGLDLQKIIWQQPVHTLIEIAHSAKQHIRSAVAPDTPLVLIGYCLGAQVAFEIARKIADAGEGYPLVCIIDTSTVTRLCSEQRSKWKLVRNAIMNLPQWLAWNCTEPDYEKLAQAVKRRLVSFQRPVQIDEIMGIRNPTAFDSATFPQPVLEVMRANFEALATYTPGSYAGPVAVFRTRKRTLFADRESTMGWGAVSTGEIEVNWISGLHHTCMAGKDLKENMVTINSRIEAYRTTR